ncbi:MAG: hypothetical protein CW338_12125 [Clostridiales bacterium]|nr:hypothetical protein [Clostridiales bacterium]
MYIGGGSSVRSDYVISRITIKADGTEFYWVDLVNNNRDSRFYTTTPGMYFICPEIAVWQQLASASNISVSVTAYRYGSGQTFNITPNGCNAFREFARAIVNNNLHDLCDLGDMNAAGQVYPMRTTVTSVSYRDGQQLRVINCNSSISLRTQPDPDAPRICMIPKGEYVTYRGNAGNGFYLVEYGRYMGYASSLYLGR